MAESPPSERGYELRGALSRGLVDRIVLLFVGMAFVLSVTMLGKFIERMTVPTLVVGVVATGGLMFVFVRALWVGRARLEIHPDHVFFDYRPQGAADRYFVIEFDGLTSVALNGVRLLFRTRGGPTVEFCGNRLHVEDAFEVLATHLETDYPECMILRRGRR